LRGSLPAREPFPAGARSALTVRCRRPVRRLGDV